MLYGNIGLSNKFRIAIQAYDARGNIVWECELDIYGKVRNLHGEKTFIPFRFSGQYEDIETGLYYNRFRYYSPDTGTYISQDPIGLLGNNPNFYAYVKDSNSRIDPFGLFDWKGHLEKISGTKSPSGMERPHAHHIVFKKGHANQQAILKESKSILEKYKIDWLKGKENLTWAPNKNHSKKAAQRVLDALKIADKKGTREAIVDALSEMGKKFANDTICK
ncbi:RHS repeat-associated core domain-containing protein [Tenacibaculum maritimum]|uniref:RHS repeat-associated core domain-containing protein n=1 Tax=Tenacibaculum maritimum TaxID=107401 RepID=UPI00132F91B6|nr:RHS repeat-associated core domain-containing protein [Tenacibaculum maritimum]